jgi:uncharacterized protein YecT (DUF1311 family)
LAAIKKTIHKTTPMKSCEKYILSIIFIFSITSIVQSQTRSFSGDSQTDMNVNAREAYSAWEKKMQKVLLAAIEKNKDDKVFVANLKKSQKNWEVWRDSEIETFYPVYEDSKDFYGSMQPLCCYSKLIDWTEERIKQLKVYSKIEKYDLCAPGRN